MFEVTISFWTVYVIIGLFVMSRVNWTNRANDFIDEYISAFVAILLWPLILMISNNRT